MAAELDHVEKHSIRILLGIWKSLIHHEGISCATKILGEKVLVFKEQKCSDLGREQLG